MNINDFVANFAAIFDDTDPAEITAETVFQNLDEWDSLTALSIIALVKTKYAKTISGSEIRQCLTVSDLFNVVLSK